MMALPRELKACDPWDRHVLPLPFLDELRRAVDLGITPMQVDSMVNLVMMVYGMMDTFDPIELAGRVRQITRSMDDVAKSDANRERLRRLSQSP